MGTYVAVLVLCTASLTVGAAVRCPRRGWTWTAPAVGFASVMLIALGGLRLPGHAATAAALIAAATALSAVALARRRVDPRAALRGAPIGVVVLAAASLPFIANARIGELGASVLDDLSFHLGQADELRRIGPAAHITAAGYPQGPHTLVAALGAGTGIDTASVFAALLLAAPVLIALSALDGLPGRLRGAAAVLVGLPYLVASYLAEGAFKEPILALFLLAFALVLRDTRAGERRGERPLFALLLIAGASVADFGVAALVWLAGTLLWLGVMERLSGTRPMLPTGRAARRGLAAAVLAGVAALAVLAVASGFFTTGPGRFLGTRHAGGNFVGQISPLEALGAWHRTDFRYGTPGAWFWPAIVLVLALTLGGFVWCWRRRELALLAAALSGISVYVVARPVTLAYFSGKALVVVAPLLTLVAGRALFAAEPAGGSLRRAAWGLAGAALAVVLAGSSALALRDAHVRPHDREAGLAAFRPVIAGRSTLYLGRDDFMSWDLRGTTLWGFQIYGLHLDPQAAKAPTAPSAVPPAVDIDSVPPEVLDRYRYVVAPRTAYASAMPANLRRVRSSRWYTLYERRGPTADRSILNEGEAPGARLDCRRTFAGPPPAGVAYVRPEPVVASPAAWGDLAGAATGGGMTSGGTQTLTLPLGRGTWDLSLQYFSDVPLHLRADGMERTLPASIDDPSSYWTAARIRTTPGAVTVTVHAAPPRALATERSIRLGSVAATRVDLPGRLVPLARACGAYVDWYRVRG